MKANADNIWQLQCDLDKLKRDYDGDTRRVLNLALDCVNKNGADIAQPNIILSICLNGNNKLVFDGLLFILVTQLPIP